MDEDPFEKQMCLAYEAREAQVRVSPSKDMSNHTLISWRSGSKKTKLRTSLMTSSARKASPWFPCIWRRDTLSLYFSWKTTAYALKENTMDKTDDTYWKHKNRTVGKRLVGERVRISQMT